MEKYKFDENNGLWYELQGDYCVNQFIAVSSGLNIRTVGFMYVSFIVHNQYARHNEFPPLVYSGSVTVSE